MDMFTDQTEFTDVHVFQTVINMFESHPQMRTILKHSLGLDFDYERFRVEDDYGRWVHHGDCFGVYPRHSERSGGRGNHASRSSSSAYHSPLQLYASSHDPSSLSSAKENDTERKARSLEECRKSKGKAEKKKKKKLKKKERKRREKLEKEKQKGVKNEEGKDGAQESETEESKTVNYEEHTSCSGKLMAPAEDTVSSDSSEQESSDEDGDTKDDPCASEELDMTSTFVSKAALIAKRKLEQKPKTVRTETKKVTDKEERKSVPEKPSEGQEVEKSSAAASSPTFEDNIKISTDLAVIGNKFASAGDFNMAVKFFTDAIKYNPTEFKLFGNRSFCFEKLQEYDKALADAELTLGICPGWVKGLFRKGRALAGLKRYDEAARAFRDVLKLDSSCTEAAQELMRVQITQLMECGFTREQSSNALIIHGTVEKALGVLSKLNRGTGAVQNSSLPSVQVANVTGVSPILSAKANPAPAAAPPPAQAQDASKNPRMNKPLVPVQNMSNVYNRPPGKVQENHPLPGKKRELFPVWVGNLNYTVTESMITNMFNKVGVVYSVKVLFSKGCAFVNFTKQECCDEAIRRFHGYELGGVKIAVRYPDRIPPGMGISKFALRSNLKN